MVVPGGLSFQYGFPGGKLLYSSLLPRRNGSKYSQADTPVLHSTGGKYFQADTPVLEASIPRPKRQYSTLKFNSYTHHCAKNKSIQREETKEGGGLILWMDLI